MLAARRPRTARSAAAVSGNSTVDEALVRIDEERRPLDVLLRGEGVRSDREGQGRFGGAPRV
jgi:hypothetical protein